MRERERKKGRERQRERGWRKRKSVLVLLRFFPPTHFTHRRFDNQPIRNTIHNNVHLKAVVTDKVILLVCSFKLLGLFLFISLGLLVCLLVCLLNICRQQLGYLGMSPKTMPSVLVVHVLLTPIKPVYFYCGYHSL